MVANIKYETDRTMSFKRVGDDFDSIKVQKKRRVTDLLLEDIPEEEATLMRNGRLACLVCKHNPVFDTVAVLSVHRQGKKHLANAKVRLERLQQDAELRQKREHENYLKDFKPDPTQGQDNAPLLMLTQKRKELALNSSSTLITPVREPDPLAKHKNMPFFQSRAELKFPNATRTLDSARDSALPTNTSGQDMPSRSQGRKLNRDESSSSNNQSTFKHSSTCSAAPSNSFGSTKPTGVARTAAESVEEKARRDYSARLRRDGWIMDLDGKWKKDENVEFDSDEDEPRPLE